MQSRIGFLITLSITLGSSPLYAQLGNGAERGFDSLFTPIAGPASAPPLSNERYSLPDLRTISRLNSQLPRWLQFGLEERVRFEGYSGNRLASSSGESYLINRLRLSMILQPESWLKVVAQGQDARSFFQTPPSGPPNNVRWDLKLAYVQFGDAEKQPVTLSVGRQIIDYNNTIIGNSEWRNQARSYDAVVTDLHLNRFRVALFAASVVSPMRNGISHHLEGNNIYGAYGWIKRVVPKSSIEPFALWRIAPSVQMEASKFQTGRLDEKAYGFRISGKGILNFDYSYELVSERGWAGTNPIRAWATTAGLGYSLPSLVWKPRFFTDYNFASGDANAMDGTRGTFDTMYSTAHDRFGITDQFGWQNIVAGRLGVTVIPHGRWSLTAQYLNLRLASASDAAYNSSGGVIIRDTTGKSGTHLGEELDLYTWYEINRQVRVGAGFGHLMPGEFLAKAKGSGSYTYPYFVIEFTDGKRAR